MCSIQRECSVSGSFARFFPLPLIEARLYLDRAIKEMYIPDARIRNYTGHFTGNFAEKFTGNYTGNFTYSAYAVTENRVPMTLSGKAKTNLRNKGKD
jgi:hypothetical protein